MKNITGQSRSFTGNLVSTTELKTFIGHRKECKGRHFERLPFVRAIDEGLTLETSSFKLFTVGNLSFKLSC